MAGWRYCCGGTAWEVVHCQRGPAVPLLLYRGEGVAVVAAECQRRSRGWRDADCQLVWGMLWVPVRRLSLELVKRNT
jgi:hypothetical protein